jgi:hypothetical protein
MELSALQLEIYLNFIDKTVKELNYGTGKKVTRKEIRNIFKLIYPLKDYEINAIINEYLRLKRNKQHQQLKNK